MSIERKKIDDLAMQAGGYFSLPSEDSMAYTELLFDICQQFGIHYYTATPKERYFVEEVTRVTWAKQQEARPGVKFCVSDFRQSQEWRWKAGRILA